MIDLEVMEELRRKGEEIRSRWLEEVEKFNQEALPCPKCGHLNRIGNEHCFYMCSHVFESVRPYLKKLGEEVSMFHGMKVIIEEAP